MAEEMKGMSLEERAYRATRAYIERLGMEPIAVGFMTAYGDIMIVALDEGTFVNIKYRVSEDKLEPEPIGEDEYWKIIDYVHDARLTGFVRCDTVDIFVMAEDKALLRHYRGETRSLSDDVVMN
jgi:hypothetical protein